MIESRLLARKILFLRKVSRIHTNVVCDINSRSFIYVRYYTQWPVRFVSINHYHLPCSQAIDCEKETFKIYGPKFSGLVR